MFELRAVDGQSAPYCLFAPTGVAMPPRTAGFGNRDRFELNGKIGLHRRQDNSASGMLPVARWWPILISRFAPRNWDFTAIVANIIS
jgi:hypothetical protein